jgi:hypothetical protein
MFLFFPAVMNVVSLTPYPLLVLQLFFSLVFNEPKLYLLQALLQVIALQRNGSLNSHLQTLMQVVGVKAKMPMPTPWRHRCKGNSGIAPLILNLGTSWRGVINFTPWPQITGKERRYLLNTRLDGFQRRSGGFGEDKIFCLFQDSTPGSSTQ